MEIDDGTLPKRGRLNRATDGAAQPIVLHHVESGFSIGGWGHDRRPGFWIVADFARPKLCVLQQPRLHVSAESWSSCGRKSTESQFIEIRSLISS